SATAQVRPSPDAPPPPASLSGYVYVDLNENGIRDAGETGISGVTVTLTGVNDLGQPVSRTLTTDADGLYNFTGLRPGTYALRETQPPGYRDGLESVGSHGGSAWDDEFFNLVLPAGALALH